MSTHVIDATHAWPHRITTVERSTSLNALVRFKHMRYTPGNATRRHGCPYRTTDIELATSRRTLHAS